MSEIRFFLISTHFFVEKCRFPGHFFLFFFHGVFWDENFFHVTSPLPPRCDHQSAPTVHLEGSSPGSYPAFLVEMDKALWRTQPFQRGLEVFQIK